MQQLASSGAHVQQVAAYERRAPRWSESEQHQADQSIQDGSLWVFSSSEAVSHLAQLRPDADWSLTPCICTHERIAQTTRELGFIRILSCRPAVDDVAALCHAQ